MTQTHTQKSSGVTIRGLGPRDAAEVLRLAQLDSAAPPSGRLLGAEVEGRLVAAVSIDSGHTIADPFGRTAELRALLDLRASQLRRRERSQRRVAWLRRGRTRGALPSSPPGAGGRLLSLPVRPY